jgi:hypothetical protein
MSLATLREAYPHSFSDREQLVKQLHEEKKTLHSEDVKLAFLAIPREAFVPFFSVTKRQSRGKSGARLIPLIQPISHKSIRISH